MNDVIEIENGVVYEKINLIMQDMPAIPKRGQNTQQKFAYRKIDDVFDVLQPLLSKHKIITSPETLDCDRQIIDKGGKKVVSVCIKMQWRIICTEDQSCFVAGPMHGEAFDYGDKAVPKAQSMALKYMLS